MFRRSLPSALATAFLLASTACHEVHFDPAAQGEGEIDIFDNLFSIVAPTPDHIVATGYWGSIYVSEDGGTSWIEAKSGTKNLVYDVSMADDKKGWAVGQLGLILRTEDGGRTWTQQPNPKEAGGYHLFAVQAIDAQTAWAVGEWGSRIVTRDGGATWEDESLTIGVEHPQFVWLGPSEQEQVRSGEKVFEDVGLNDIYCLPQATNYCWIIGEFAYLFRSEDSGRTWERAEIISTVTIDPLVLGHNEVDISEEQQKKVMEFSQAIADQQHLNIAIEPRVTEREVREFGKAEDPFPLFEIIDARTQSVQTSVEEAGILTDRVRRRGPPPWDYEDFLEDDPTFLERYFKGRVADSPSVEVSLAQNPYLFTVRFADPMEGYISGLGGVVLRSNDGGRTWHYEDIGRKQAVFSVQPMPGGERAFIVGEKGLMRTSTDGGKTWDPIDGFPTIFTYMRDITFSADGKTGYIAGQRGTVMKTEDGGQSWRQILPPVVEVAGS